MMQVKLENLSEVVEPFPDTVEDFVVFDFDDTIAKTFSKVVVKNKVTGEPVKKVNSQGYLSVTLGKDEEFDFTDFNRVVRPKMLRYSKELFRNHASKISSGKTALSILTARGKEAQPSIRKFLFKVLKGVPSYKSIVKRKIHIECLGSSNPQLKTDWIKNTSKQFPNIKRVIFLDDAEKNIKSVNVGVKDTHIQDKTLTADPAKLPADRRLRKKLAEKRKKCEGMGCGKRKKVLLNVKIGA